MQSNLTGQAVVHEDGDPGVITHDAGTGWDVRFCSGYKGHFPLPVGKDDGFPFAFMPTIPDGFGDEQVGPEAIDSRLEVLSEIIDLVEEERSIDCDAIWAEHCSGWLGSDEFKSLVAKREWIRDTKLREVLQREVLDLVDALKVSEAESLYAERCRNWWPSKDFEPIIARARFAREFIESYVSGSLEEIDYCYRHSSNLPGASPASDIAELKQPKIDCRLARLGMRLDSDQRTAIGRPDRRLLVRARAGSGKTRTLAAMAAILIADAGLNADQILTVAFNKKAAEEIGDRIRDVAGVAEYRNARTFHSLAHRLAGNTGRSLVFDDGNLQPSRRNQSRFIERVIHRILNPAFRERLYEFFRKELEQVERIGSNLPEREYFHFRRAMSDFTLGGENVKSNGEKYIADFLFEHGISYVYEKVYSWAGSDRIDGSPYRPDFSISVGGRDVILEHWAIDPSDPGAQVPAWWKDVGSNDYREQIDEKRKFWRARGVLLLETHTAMLRNGREHFESVLYELFGAEGIRCQKLSNQALVDRVAEAPRTISRVSELFLGFISRAKKRGWTVSDVARLAAESPDPEPRNRIFNELATRAYGEYERLLATESAMDFDDLLVAATNRIRTDGAASTIGLSRKDAIQLADLRVVLLDEFQDFSELYARLLNAIIEVNSDVRVIAVGDDWQAINGFAGAQLTFFSRFDEHFPGGGTTSISTNYRSGRAIVGAGNAVMRGYGQGAIASSKESGLVERRYVDKEWVNDSNDVDQIFLEAAKRSRQGNSAFLLAKALKACATFICESSYTKNDKKWLPKTLVISRTGYAYGELLTDFERILLSVLRKHPDLKDVSNEIEVEVLTAHRAKGKEADTVIVVEATGRQFPKIHADNQLFGLFGVTAEDTLAEERRLFYVAVTRAEYRLLLLTETDKESPFIESLRLEKGLHHLTTLAAGSAVPNGIESDLGRDLQRRIAAIDCLELVRQNVSPAAAAALDRLLRAGFGVPQTGYFLAGSLCAELAWPESSPPVAVISGAQRKNAEDWRAAGWVVHIV